MPEDSDEMPGGSDDRRAQDSPGENESEPDESTPDSADRRTNEDAAHDDSPSPDASSDHGTAHSADEETMNPAETKAFEQFRGDLEAVERKIAGEIDPGARALVVAVSVFVLLLSLVLPHAGGARGLDVLLFDGSAQDEHIGLPSRVFEWFTLLFGIGFSSLALLTRRWVLAWIAVAGSAIGSVFGVLSIWHRQTPGLGNYHGAGPGVGLILATIAIIVLTFHWVKVVWSRTALHLEAEEQRRRAATEQEERDRRRLFGDDGE